MDDIGDAPLSYTEVKALADRPRRRCGHVPALTGGVESAEAVSSLSADGALPQHTCWIQPEVMPGQPW